MASRTGGEGQAHIILQYDVERTVWWMEQRQIPYPWFWHRADRDI